MKFKLNDRVRYIGSIKELYNQPANVIYISQELYGIEFDNDINYPLHNLCGEADSNKCWYVIEEYIKKEK